MEGGHPDHGRWDDLCRYSNGAYTELNNPTLDCQIDRDRRVWWLITGASLGEVCNLANAKGMQPHNTNRSNGRLGIERGHWSRFAHPIQCDRSFWLWLLSGILLHRLPVNSGHVLAWDPIMEWKSGNDYHDTLHLAKLRKHPKPRRSRPGIYDYGYGIVFPLLPDSATSTAHPADPFTLPVRCEADRRAHHGDCYDGMVYP